MLCNGRVARMAAVFFIRLCKANFEGFRNQLKKDGMAFEGGVGMQDIDQATTTTTPTTTINNYGFAEVDGNGSSLTAVSGSSFDNLTQQELPELLLKAARRKEIALHRDQDRVAPSACVRSFES